MAEASTENRMVVARIQNNRNPSQFIDLIWDRDSATFQTVGLKETFGVKEIRIRVENPLEALDRYAEVLSFLFQTMSEAQEIHLPYAYQEQFQFAGRRFVLAEEGDHRLLMEVDGTG